MTEQIRPAVASDVDAMVDLARKRREAYAEYEPVFWRQADDAERAHQPFLASLVSDADAIVLVSEDSGRITGFIIVTLAKAPPVYDPGGLTALIDDFTVEPGKWLSAGADLLRTALDAASQRGAVQAIVVTAHLDEQKRRTLQAAGLHIASEWWLTSVFPTRVDSVRASGSGSLRDRGSTCGGR